MKKISQILDKLEEIILVVCLSLMTLITFANVVSRKVLHFPWAFAEELTVILFIFSSLVGAAVAAKRGSLIGLTLLYDICHKNLRKIFFVVLLLASVLAGIGAAVLLFFRKKKKKERIPFVPFVFTAYVLLLL